MPSRTGSDGLFEGLASSIIGRQNGMSCDEHGLLAGLCRLYHHQDMPKERFERYRKRFSPYGEAASLALWETAAGRAEKACDSPEKKERSA